uniref:von Willebrand factor A domain-containing protein 7-like n=1 Tax=Monopterus albus TaxID=43700 RepID=UPI0009B464E9|nr:von Willebrand factor A domain-containing protein 7-like [Monopterus albus]
MSLSGLQLALTGASPGSEIFVFTDAPAKDVYLKQTVIALIEQTKSVVNFMITNVLGLRRRRQSDDNQQQQQYRMLTSDFQLYNELAEVSGGQAIQVTKSELLRATSIVRESTSASQVTLLQAVRDTGNAENFTFTVDETVKNLTVYITGKSVTFTLISPSGVHQDSTNMTGSLITASQSVGNFQTLQLNTQVGLWEIKMVSPNPYTLKVVGVSPIGFLFNFLEVSKSPRGGSNIVDGRPRAGVNASMMVTISGSDSAIVREVTLVESLGSGMVNSTIETQSGRNILIRFDKIPSARFAVLVKGQISNASTKASSVPFQRQSSTTIRSSNVTVTVTDKNSVLVPGTPRLLPFSVTTSGAGGNFIIQVTNDQGFSLTFPSSLSLEAGGSAYGIVTITAPPDTTSGTSVTLTIGAEAPGGADTNYAVLRLTVQTTETVTQPVCLLLSLLSNCSYNCSLSMWELSVQVTDGFNGTGIDVRLTKGSGILNTSLTSGNVSTTLVSYRASCCSPDVELLVVDQASNVGICSYTVRNNVTATSAQVSVASFSAKAVQSFLLCLSIWIPGLTLP